MPKVTIGMPTFNRAKLLRKAIEQVLTQSYQDYEFIIYNDGSTDETINVINSFNDHRIIIINEINKGMPHPLNGILKIAKGEYIIILHDHDFFNPQLIEKSVIALDNNSAAGFVLQGSAWIDDNEISNYNVCFLDLPEYVNGKDFLNTYLLNKEDFSSPIHACCMVRKSAYEKVGKYYDEKFGWYADNDLWMRLLKNYDFIYLKEILLKFRGREVNHILHQKAWEINKWIYDIHLENIKRNFQDDSILFEKAMTILRFKIGKSSKKIFYQSLIKGDESFLDESIIENEKYNNDIFFILMKYLLKRNKLIKHFVLKIGPYLNRFRKLLVKYTI